MLNARDRARGLLKYEKAPASYAGIFKLPFFGFLPIIHTFGMKFSIDIIFCDRSKKVQQIFHRVEKGRLIVPWANLLGGFSYLIETAAGASENVKVGTQLEWT